MFSGCKPGDGYSTSATVPTHSGIFPRRTGCGVPLQPEIGTGEWLECRLHPTGDRRISKVCLFSDRRRTSRFPIRGDRSGLAFALNLHSLLLGGVLPESPANDITPRTQSRRHSRAAKIPGLARSHPCQLPRLLRAAPPRHLAVRSPSFPRWVVAATLDDPLRHTSRVLGGNRWFPIPRPRRPAQSSQF